MMGPAQRLTSGVDRISQNWKRSRSRAGERAHLSGNSRPGRPGGGLEDGHRAHSWQDPPPQIRSPLINTASAAEDGRGAAWPSPL